MFNLDKNGQPLRDAISWLDQRRTEGLPPVKGLWGIAFALAGASNTVAYLQAEAEANWIRTHQPEIWQQTYKYLLTSGYLTYQLIGKFVDLVGCQAAYIPFDYKAQTWAAPSDWKWQAVPMDPAKLPDLVPPASPLGAITPQAAAATGIPAGLQLIAAAGDKACEVIGSGALASHIGCLSYGSAATINTTHKRYIEVIPLIPPYPSAVPGMYSLEIQIFRGYWMVNWFKQEFGLREMELAEETGVETEALFDELVRSVPPGSQGLGCSPTGPPACVTPAPKRAAPSSASATCTRVPTSTAPSSKGSPMPCARAPSAPPGAAACPSPSCAWPAAAARATPPCRSPPTSSACPPHARMYMKPPGWALPSTPPWALASIPISKRPSKP